MIEVVRRIDLEERQRIELAGTPIEAARGAPPPAAAPRAEAGCPRRYCTPELNSRLPATLPAGPWKVRWQAMLNETFAPDTVVQQADRILTQGGGLWQLFDTAGKELQQGRYSGSAVVLDAERSLFYAVNRSSSLAAYRLSTGEAAFLADPTYGDVFVRPYLARRGDRLVVVGVETEGFPHRPKPPNRSLAEYIQFDHPPQVHPYGLLLPTGQGQLEFRTAKLEAAMAGDTLVLAIPSRVYLADISLHVRRALDGDFQALLMSLDEAGRIYLVALVGEEKVLWVVTPEGKRLVSLTLKPEHQTVIAPPIVGYDHRIYLLTRSLVVALDAEGKLLWERAAGGAVAGAGVAADHRLLVAAGEELAVFDPDGERRLLYRFRGEPLVTPPVLTAGGEILLASARRLYCLGR